MDMYVGWTENPIVRDELREIEKLLSSNGWVLSAPSRKDEKGNPQTAEYVKGYYDGEGVVIIQVALTPEDLGCYGRYGICSVQVLRHYNPIPYNRDDLREMGELITDAEQELLELSIPFRPNYGFGKRLEYSIEKSLELREKYHLAQYEKEDVYG